MSNRKKTQPRKTSKKTARRPVAKKTDDRETAARMRAILGKLKHATAGLALGERADAPIGPYLAALDGLADLERVADYLDPKGAVPS